jgi:hypothetical protein
LERSEACAPEGHADGPTAACSGRGQAAPLMRSVSF